MTRLAITLSYVSLLFVAIYRTTQAAQPHIIYILADDLGWNDVGFHGSGQIPTPNIDALAYSGLLFDRYYATPVCTPSRSALMTGKYPIHTGMQHSVLRAYESRGLPLSEKLLPEYLRDLGYRRHIVGKWHLGFYKKEYTPIYRGFEDHIGYWTAHQDYFDHTTVDGPFWGLDMRRGLEPAWDLHGQYSTDIFTNESVKIIEQHNSSQPLFLYVAHAAVHSGNGYNPLPAPDAEVAKFTNISDYDRRRFAGMLTKLDESVGMIVDTLQKNNMLKDSIIIFCSDNGGAAHGFYPNAASNWPLRGVKATLWEGAVRAAGLMWSPLISRPGRVSKQTFHIVDWLPTLLSAAGGDPSNLTSIDGLDMWKALIEDTESPRKTILHNIDDNEGTPFAAVTVGEWKMVQGMSYVGGWDDSYGPSGREWVYDVDAVIGSLAARALAKIGVSLTANKIWNLRDEALIKCSPKDYSLPQCKLSEAPCLFNIQQDPCEDNNLANVFPTILRKLQDEIKKYNATAIPPGNKGIDERSNPDNWGHVWTNYGDYTVQ